jgi:hypothetical protein
MEIESDQLMDLAQARRFFPTRNGKPLTVPTIRRYIAERLLPSHRIKNRYYLRPSEIRDFNLRDSLPAAADDPAARRLRLLAGRDPHMDAKVDRLLASEGYFGGAKKREVHGLPAKGRSRRPLSLLRTDASSFDNRLGGASGQD